MKGRVALGPDAGARISRLLDQGSATRGVPLVDRNSLDAVSKRGAEPGGEEGDLPGAWAALSRIVREGDGRGSILATDHVSRDRIDAVRDL